jgi:L-amino acid N-acyltransferase YncA
MSNLKAVSVRLRPATQEDCLKVWEWRNEQTTRDASFDTDPVPYQDHQTWYSRKIGDPSTKIYIAEDLSGHQIGYVRFDIDGDHAEISISLDKGQRRKGYGSALIRRGSDQLLEAGLTKKIVAIVKSSNPTSAAAFQRAGFAVSSTKQIRGADAIELVYERAHT